MQDGLLENPAFIKELSISSRNASISPREAFDFSKPFSELFLATLHFDIPILGLGETKPILSVEIERAAEKCLGGGERYELPKRASEALKQNLNNAFVRSLV